MENRLRFADTGEAVPHNSDILPLSMVGEIAAEQYGRVIEVVEPCSTFLVNGMCDLPTGHAGGHSILDTFDMIGIDDIIDRDREAAKFGGAA